MIKNTLSLLFLVYSISAVAQARPIFEKVLCENKDMIHVMDRYKWSNGFADQDAPFFTQLSPMNMGLIRDGRYNQDGDMVLFFHKKEHRFYLYVYNDNSMWNGFVDTLNVRKAMLSTFPLVLVTPSPNLEKALHANGWNVESCSLKI